MRRLEGAAQGTVSGLGSAIAQFGTAGQGTTLRLGDDVEVVFVFEGSDGDWAARAATQRQTSGLCVLVRAAQLSAIMPHRMSSEGALCTLNATCSSVLPGVNLSPSKCSGITQSETGVAQNRHPRPDCVPDLALTFLRRTSRRASAADEYAKRLLKLSKHHFGTGETGCAACPYLEPSISPLDLLTACANGLDTWSAPCSSSSRSSRRRQSRTRTSPACLGSRRRSSPSLCRSAIRRGRRCVRCRRCIRCLESWLSRDQALMHLARYPLQQQANVEKLWKMLLNQRQHVLKVHLSRLSLECTASLIIHPTQAKAKYQEDAIQINALHAQAALLQGRELDKVSDQFLLSIRSC